MELQLEIRQKIWEGKAHELSERNTTYLGACTKGEGHNKDFTSQPFSDIKAKRRAYSLKATFINRIIDFHLNKIQDLLVEPQFHHP